MNRATGKLDHRKFSGLVEFLSAGDVLVLNNSRVIPARLRGVNATSGGKFELLLLEENSVNDWTAMLRPGKRAQIGTKLILRDTNGADTGIITEVIEITSEGNRRLKFSGTNNISDELEKIGEPPLPPYIERKNSPPIEEDRERYQTVFAKPPGSVAAPTAGLHFSGSLLEKISALGVKI